MKLSDEQSQARLSYAMTMNRNLCASQMSNDKLA